MSLNKKSQFDYDGVSVPTDTLFADDNPFGAPPMASEYSEPSSSADDGEVLFEIDELFPSNEENVLCFELSNVPGGAYQDELEEPVEIEVEEDSDIQIEDDPWGWQISTFLNWLSGKMQGVPQHSGCDSVGLERAMAYLEAIDREISKAVRSDINGEIDISSVEKARDELYKGLERLQDRFDKIQSNKHPKRKKKKKKADDSPHVGDLLKEAQKATHVGGIVVTVPLLISSIARTCLNSMISAGKDIEDVFDRLAEKYELTPREEMETMQLLADMGYPMRRPRGYHRDEEIDYTSSDNFDWAQNFPG